MVVLAKQAAYPVYLSDNPLILTWRFPAPTAKLTSSADIQREVIARQLTLAKETYKTRTESRYVRLDIPAKQAAYPVYFSDNPLILTWRFPAPTAKLTSSAAIQREVIARQLTPAKQTS